MYRYAVLPWLLVLFWFQTAKLVQPADPLLTTALGGVTFNQFQEVFKPCHEDCAKFGNCNYELGVCECPFGYTGPSCQTPLLPACRTNTDPGASIFVGATIPRNCHCYRQLLSAYCLPGDTTRCASHTLALWETLKCFEHVSLPPEQQTSDFPDRLDDPSFRWYRGIRYQVLEKGEGDEMVREVRDLQLMDKPPPEEDLHGAQPLSKCPNRCNDRGVCKDGRCMCMEGFGGHDCGEQVASELCPSGCSGRGRCVGGFCKCDPPYWGVACSRQKAYEPVPGSVAHPYYPALKVYVYDIPLIAHGPQPFDDGAPDVFVIYQAFLRLLEMFLRDGSGVRTQNPHEANLFYVPAFAHYAGSNLGDPTAAVVRAVDWAATHFPFFNRSEGRDHFVVLTADRGACYLQPLPQTKNLIRLVHFGLERPNITDMGSQVGNREYGCFKGGRDVVLPPFFHPKEEAVREVHQALAQPGGAEALLAKKTVLFFFSGDVRHQEKEYSGGVRQALEELLRYDNPPDVVFKGGYQPLGPGEYEQLLSTSRFCLAPYGHGWGIRLTHALMHGCVPVIIQDKVRQPYEDLLHYPDFSVRVPKADLPRLVERLRAVPDEDVVRMMRESARVYRAFIWQPELGGLAYNYTLASLWRRLSHLRGELYEAGTRRRRMGHRLLRQH